MKVTFTMELEYDLPIQNHERHVEKLRVATEDLVFTGSLEYRNGPRVIGIKPSVVFHDEESNSSSDAKNNVKENEAK